MRILRASEIGSYCYCRRAWWFWKRGGKPSNQAELIAGTELHSRHGNQVVVATMVRWLAGLCLLAALILLAIYYTLQLF